MNTTTSRLFSYPHQTRQKMLYNPAIHIPQKDMDDENYKWLMNRTTGIRLLESCDTDKVIIRQWIASLGRDPQETYPLRSRGIVEVVVCVVVCSGIGLAKWSAGWLAEHFTESIATPKNE